MKINNHLILLIALLCAGPVGQGSAQDNAAQREFNSALFREWANGDPAEAAKEYAVIADHYRTENRSATPADFQRAVTLRRLGQYTESLAAISSVITNVNIDDSPLNDSILDYLYEMMMTCRLQNQKETALRIQEMIQNHSSDYLQNRQEMLDQLYIPLRGRITTWDGHLPCIYNAYIEKTVPEMLKGYPFNSLTLGTSGLNIDTNGMFTGLLTPGEYIIHVRTPTYQRVRYHLTVYPEITNGFDYEVHLEKLEIPATISNVYLVGTWMPNRWDDYLPMIPTSNGMWKLRQTLPPGTYQYKFIINNFRKWLPDVRGSVFSDDHRGSFNAVLVVTKRQDIVFQFDENDPRFQRRD